METQQSDPHENRETNPHVPFSSEQIGSEGKEPNTRDRGLDSGSENQDKAKNPSKSQGQVQAQPKPLDSSFGTFYKIVMVMYLLVSVGSIIFVIVAGFKSVEFDKFGSLVVCWGLVQYLYAFLGVIKKDSKKIERAWTMMKIYFLLVGVASLKKGFEVMKADGGSDFGFLKARVLQIIFYVVLVFLPTREVRKILKDHQKVKSA